MAKRIQFMGTKIVESDSGLGWQRNKETGKYETEMFGMTYELEKRGGTQEMRAWYLFSTNHSHFWGEQCAVKLFDAIEEASDLIMKADLRGEGYEKKEN